MTLPKRATKQSGYEGRGYKRLGSSGPILPSVTTILKAEAKDALVQWAANQTAAFAVANADKLLGMSDARGYGFLRYFWNREPKDPLSGDIDPASHHSGVLKDAGELGDSVHEWAEASLFSEMPYPDVGNRNEKFWECIEVWEQFRKEHNIIPHRVENTVWDERADSDGLGYAGTFDLLCEIDGTLYLLDIKTSRGLYHSTWMQLAALFNARYLLEEGPDGTDSMIEGWQKPIEKLAVIHIRPSDTDWKGNYMPPFCKLIEMPAPHDQMFSGFMGLRQYTEMKREVKL